MTDAVNWIEDAARAGAELRALIREAHETARDIKQLTRELREVRAGIPADIERTVEETISETVGEGLARYAIELERAIASADADIDRRFKTLGDIMLGSFEQEVGL